VSRVVIPTNGAGKMTLPFLLSASLLGVSSRDNSFLIVRIILVGSFILVGPLVFGLKLRKEEYNPNFG